MENMADIPELETTENIRLAISICDSSDNLIKKLKKLDYYTNKYLSFIDVTKQQQNTEIRRIV